MAAHLRHRCRDLAHRRAAIMPAPKRRSSSGAWASRSTSTAPTMRAASSRWRWSPARSAGPAPGSIRCAARTTCRAPRMPASSRCSMPTTARSKATKVRAFYEELWGAALDPKRGLTVVEIMTAIHDEQGPRHVHHGREPGHVRPRCAACARGAGEARTSRRAGHLPHRDRALRRCRAAGLGLARKDRHRHQHQPPGADGPDRAAAAGRRAPGSVDHPGDRAPHRPRLELRRTRRTCSPR